LGLM